MSDSLAHGMWLVLNAARSLVGAAFLASLLVALTHWLVREQKLQPFGAWPRFVRGWSDPLLRPIEQRLAKAGGNPQHAPWWLAGLVVVGGLVAIELLRMVFGFVMQLTTATEVGAASAAAVLVDAAIRVLMAALLIRVIGSWFGLGRYHRWIRWTYAITDWLVEPVRRALPPFGMLDLSPMVAYLLLMLARMVMFRVLF